MVSLRKSLIMFVSGSTDDILLWMDIHSILQIMIACFKEK
jgi:hypothetical protein